ncbi:pentapeptide repeat-containing protein [Nocardiopsis metallicus]|uniref:Pentapeptide repeat-containing protein n=1 Tax=Nocardiopsis metallicus TaxID=179819 RepID=A0A840WEA7_9ACTN|nr:pentapeptide repeat-containing protein [Nocardiopsis metallicus]MBB5491341.1 hypothetical protein [Nocardiopsis metallicus]
MPPETPPSPDTPPPLARTRPRLALTEFARRRDALVTRVQKNPVRCSVVVVGLVVFVVAGWPLAARGWDAFWSLPHAGRLTLCTAALIGIIWAILHGMPLGLRKWVEEARLASVIGVAWAVAIGLVTLIVAGAWWVMGAPTPLPPDQLPPRALDSIATRAFAVVAGLGGVALLVIHYRRQRTTEADAVRAEAANVRAERASDRETTKLFTERFTTASEQLGSEHAAVRLAGVHALAHLADDAPEGREDLVQMVIDVLCAYLRMPYDPPPKRWRGDLDGQDIAEAEATGETLLPSNTSLQEVKDNRAERLAFSGLREVRHTVIRIIGDRLLKDTRWRGKNFDFSGVVFDGGNLSGAHFTGGRVSFDGAKFTSGTVSFRNTKFVGGRVSFIRAEFIGGKVGFFGSAFTDGVVSFEVTVQVS